MCKIWWTMAKIHKYFQLLLTENPIIVTVVVFGCYWRWFWKHFDSLSTSYYPSQLALSVFGLSKIAMDLFKSIVTLITLQRQIDLNMWVEDFAQVCRNWAKFCQVMADFVERSSIFAISWSLYIWYRILVKFGQNHGTKWLTRESFDPKTQLTIILESLLVLLNYRP
jgi:hypothetical protein